LDVDDSFSHYELFQAHEDGLWLGGTEELGLPRLAIKIEISHLKLHFFKLLLNLNIFIHAFSSLYSDPALVGLSLLCSTSALLDLVFVDLFVNL
jgi:hypothetical protein